MNRLCLIDTKKFNYLMNMGIFKYILTNVNVQ